MPQQNDHVLESHMCRSKYMVPSTALQEPPESATRKTAANNQRHLGKTTTCLQTSPVCQHSARKKATADSCSTRPLRARCPKSNPIARGMPPARGVARAVEINLTNQSNLQKSTPREDATRILRGHLTVSLPAASVAS